MLDSSKDNEILSKLNDALIAGGPEADLAWLRLYQIMGPLVIKSGVKKGLTLPEAQDMLQETMIELHEQIKSSRYNPGLGGLRTWILKRAGWRIVDQFRKRRPEARTPIELRDSLPVAAEEPEEAEAAPTPPAKDMERALQNLQGDVSPVEYDIFFAMVFKRESGRSVAERLGLTRNAVYLHKHHALKKLSAIMKRG